MNRIELMDTMRSNDPLNANEAFNPIEEEDINGDSSFISKNLETGEICSICFSNRSDAVILNCFHGGICMECSKDILLKQGKCPICINVLESINKRKLIRFY